MASSVAHSITSPFLVRSALGPALARSPSNQGIAAVLSASPSAARRTLLAQSPNLGARKLQDSPSGMQRRARDVAGLLPCIQSTPHKYRKMVGPGDGTPPSPESPPRYEYHFKEPRYTQTTPPPTPQVGNRRSRLHPHSIEEVFVEKCKTLICSAQMRDGTKLFQLRIPQGNFELIPLKKGGKNNFVDVYKLKNSEDVLKFLPGARNPDGTIPGIIIKRVSHQRLLRDNPKLLFHAFENKIQQHGALKSMHLPIQIADILNWETALQDGFIVQREVLGTSLVKVESTWLTNPKADFEDLSDAEKPVMRDLRELFIHIPELKRRDILLDIKPDNAKLAGLDSKRPVVEWFDMTSDKYDYDMDDFEPSLLQAVKMLLTPSGMQKGNLNMLRYLFSGMMDRLKEQDRLERSAETLKEIQYYSDLYKIWEAELR